MTSSIPFTVENAHQDHVSGSLLYRIRVSSAEEGPTIRYLTAPSRPDNTANPIPDANGALIAFNTVPSGDWNLGHLVPNTTNTKFSLACTEWTPLDTKLNLASAGPAWHNNIKFDLIDLLDAFYAQRNAAPDNSSPPSSPRPDIQCIPHLSAALLHNPGGLALSPQDTPSVIGVWAWQPGFAHGLANESRIYALLHAKGAEDLAPRFLGHITDNKGLGRDERVVGFLLECVAGAVREAGPGDLEGCRRVLERLKGLGVAYGPRLRRHSFLVREEGEREGQEVLLQGLGGAFETEGEEVLGKAIEELEAVLNGPSELV